MVYTCSKKDNFYQDGGLNVHEVFAIRLLTFVCPLQDVQAKRIHIFLRTNAKVAGSTMW